MVPPMGDRRGLDVAKLEVKDPEKLRAACEKQYGWRFEKMPELGDAWVAELPRRVAVVLDEDEFAAHLGVEHAVATSSCTAALHLAYLAAGVGPGRDPARRARRRRDVRRRHATALAGDHDRPGRHHRARA